MELVIFWQLFAVRVAKFPLRQKLKHSKTRECEIPTLFPSLYASEIPSVIESD